MITRIFVCFAAIGLSLYTYVNKQNTLTKLRIELPRLTKEIQKVQEENARLCYRIEQFESPQHLMHLARLEEYSHLKHPLSSDVTRVGEGLALEPKAVKPYDRVSSTPVVASGS